MVPAAPAGCSRMAARRARGHFAASGRRVTCALPLEPCFNRDKQDERNFRGSVSGMGFAYCDFRRQGAAQMLLARAVARPRSLLPRDNTRSADASRAEVSARVQTPQVERTG